jgi:hypothetical protein
MLYLGATGRKRIRPFPSHRAVVTLYPFLYAYWIEKKDMSLTPTEVAQLAVTFPRTYAAQINTKAAKHRTPADDIAQEVSEIILDRGAAFDPAKGTLCQFVFGHLEKRMRRQLGALTFAVSLDRDDTFGWNARGLIENLAAPSEDDDEPVPVDSDKPGIAKALSVARFVSGKSSSELARLIGVTPRRARQMLQQLREEHATSDQFELCLEEVC